jgi:hypothetical protein
VKAAEAAEVANSATQNTVTRTIEICMLRRVSFTVVPFW